MHLSRRTIPDIRVSTSVLAKVQAELREENDALRRQVSAKESDISKLRELQAKKDPRGSLRPGALLSSMHSVRLISAGAPEHATIAELRAAKEELSGKIADLRERLEATAVLLSESEAENERHFTSVICSKFLAIGCAQNSDQFAPTSVNQMLQLRKHRILPCKREWKSAHLDGVLAFQLRAFLQGRDRQASACTSGAPRVPRTADVPVVRRPYAQPRFCRVCSHAPRFEQHQHQHCW